jgi:hypothetical protein
MVTLSELTLIFVPPEKSVGALRNAFRACRRVHSQKISLSTYSSPDYLAPDRF